MRNEDSLKWTLPVSPTTEKVVEYTRILCQNDNVGKAPRFPNQEKRSALKVIRRLQRTRLFRGAAQYCGTAYLPGSEPGPTREVETGRRLTALGPSPLE